MMQKIRVLVEKLADTCAHSHSSPARPESEPMVVVQEATPKFRELKDGEDVVYYLLGFESQLCHEQQSMGNEACTLTTTRIHACLFCYVS